MVDEQFRRPGFEPEMQPVPPRTGTSVWTPEPIPVTAPPVSMVEVDTDTFGGRTPGTRMRTGLAAGMAGIVAGLIIGVMFVDLPAPGPLPITLDTFPQEVLGQQRDDIEWRTANSAPVVERLDAQFEDQLAAYRFAYGGEGAQFTYGEVYRLTIVNGRIAPQLPLAEDPQWDVETMVSLNSGDTSCVWHDEDGWEYTDENGLPVDPDLQFEPDDMVEPPSGWTECVLFDSTRNLSLRLNGDTPGEDALSGASRYRDVLESIHAGVTR